MLSWTSVDIVSSFFDGIQLFSILAISTVCVLFGLILALYIFELLKYEYPRVLIWTIRILLELVCNIFFISFCSIFLIILKYSSAASDKIIEYDYVSASLLNYGLVGQLVSVLMLGIVLTLTVFYEACCYESRHNDSKSITNRANSITNVISKFVYFISACLSITILITNYQLYLYIIFVLYGFPSFALIYYLPYYCNFLNYLKIFVHLDYCCVIFFFWLGLAFDNAGITFLLAVMSQVPVLIMTHFLIVFRISKIHKLEDSLLEKHYLFELSARKHLMTGDLKESILKKLKNNHKINHSTLNIIIQAYYCNDSLKNPSLGLVKVSQIKYAGFSIFVDYQIYKCKKILTDQCNNS